MKKPLISCSLLFLFLTGCHAAVPTSTDGKRILETAIQTQANGFIRLVSFEKIDGQQFEAQGLKGYRMEYKAQVEFLGDCTWGSAGVDPTEFGGDFTAKQGVPQTDLAKIAAFGTRTALRGSHADISGIIVFERSERGWRSDGVTRSGRVKMSEQKSPSTPQKSAIDISARACFANIRELDSAKQIWATENRKLDVDVPTEGDLKPYLNGKQMPSCPAGGKYTLSAVGKSPTCSVPGHTIDSILQQTSLTSNEPNADQTETSETARQALSIKCVNNLKNIGLAFRIWATDNGDAFPFNVSQQNGGTKEFCLVGADGFDVNTWRHFLVLSNELSTPKLLWCPSDGSKKPAATFNINKLGAENVSYQLRCGTEVNQTNPSQLLVRCPLHGSVLTCNGEVRKGNMFPAAQPNLRGANLSAQPKNK